MSTYQDWISMYSSSMENVGVGKTKHLRKLDLLLSAFDQEVSVIKKYMDNAYQSVTSLLLQEKQKENLPAPEIFTKTEELINLPTISNTTSFVKPKSLRLKKSPVQSKPAVKESPDMFNQSREPSCFNQNIASLSDSDSILSSPEKFSPRIKKKRSLRLTKSRELAALVAVPAKTPKIKHIVDLETDDLIESTPEVVSSSKMKSSIRTTAKKKLFERPVPKKSSQSMYTLTQLYKSKRLNNTAGKEPVLTELQNAQDNTVLIKGTQNSMLDIDDLLKQLQTESHLGDDTEMCSISVEEPKYKNCRQCDMKGSPCRRHMEPIVLREPDDTFSGFWNLDFSVNQNKLKPKNNDCDDFTQESTVFR